MPRHTTAIRLAAALAALLLVGSAAPAMAATMLLPRTEDSAQTMIAMPIADDVYAVGASVQASAATTGDMILAGSSVLVLGETSGDVAAAGAQVTIQGNTGDDVRVAGSSVTVTGNTGGDLLAAGAQLVLQGNVAGDLYAAGASLASNGTVGGRTMLRGDTVVLAGTYTGDMSVQADTIRISGKLLGATRLQARTITWEEGASIAGPLQYSSPESQDISAYVSEGGSVEYLPMKTHEQREWSSAAAAGLVLVLAVAGIVYAMVMLVLVRWALGWRLAAAGSHLLHAPVGSLGLGLAYMAATPLLGALLLGSLLFAPLGIVLLALWLLGFFFYQYIAALVLAHVLSSRMGWATTPTTHLLLALAVLAFVGALAVIPFIGWVIAIAANTAALGALIATLQHKKK